MAKALRHIGIVVSNLDSALTLYKNYLGCELVALYQDLSGNYQSQLVGINKVIMKVAILRTQDDNRIELLEYASHPGKKKIAVLSNDIGPSHFALTVKNLQELYNKSSEYPVKFISPPLTSPDGSVKVAYAILMDECLVELVEVLDERAKTSGGSAKR